MTTPVPPLTDAEIEALVSRATDMNTRFDDAVKRMNEQDGQLSDLAYTEHLDLNDLRGMLVPDLLLALRALQVQRTAERERLARARELANRIADSDRWQHLNEHVGWYCSECGAGAKPSYDMLAITHRPDCIVTLARSVLADASAPGEGSEVNE